MLILAVLCHPRRRQPAAGPVPWVFAGFFALAYLQLVCVQALFPVYRGGHWYYDWWMHYDAALVFVGDQPITTRWGPYTLASRTPLFNLTTASVMALAGHDFAVYQLASVLPSCAVVAGLSLLARDFFGRRGAVLALLLGPLNLWLLHNAWFTWPKMLAGYYLLLGLHFYVRAVRVRSAEPAAASRLFLCFWVSSLLGFLTHQVAAVYVAPLVLHAAWLARRDRTYRPGWKEPATALLLAVLLLGTWYGWLLANLGPGRVVGTTPVTQGDDTATFAPLAVLWWMSFNTFTSVVPCHLLAAPFLGPPLVHAYRGLTELYFSLFPGLLTVSLTVFLLWGEPGLLRRRTPAPAGTVQGIPSPPPAADAARVAVWLFALVGFLGAAFLHPGKINHGIAHSAAFPTALTVLAVAWGLLSKAPPRTFALVCAGTVAEFLLMFWSHWWFLTRIPEVVEDLPGNESYKDETIVFLAERLGAGQYVFLAGLVVAQLALLVSLLCWGRNQRQTALQGSSPLC
jgi:hypothetical protein